MTTTATMDNRPPTPPLNSYNTPLSAQEWETLIDDFQFGGLRRQRWTNYTTGGLPLLETSLSAILRKDFPINLKLHLIVFLEEYFSELDLDLDAAEQVLVRLVETLRLPMIDGALLREQLMTSTVSLFITLRVDGELLHNNYIRQLESLTELLLAVINRPNHAQDRHTRAVACECLRELERAYPCLLSQVAGHLWVLCQNERTHAAQSYLLLLTSVIHSIVIWKPPNVVSLLNASIPFVPFNVPQSLFSKSASNSSAASPGGGGGGGGGGFSTKEVRRVISFLLESPQFLTSCGMLEFMSLILPIAALLELQPSMLKVQFSGLIYTYDPLLCHSFLIMYLHFLDAFSAQECEIAVRRLVLLSGDLHNPLVFRLIALHWILGFIGLLSNGDFGKTKAFLPMASSFYPNVFDPLALKALKLDLLALFSATLNTPGPVDAQGGALSHDIDPELTVVRLLEDGIVSVSAFKWLPPWSTETAVAFRTFHKFLLGPSSHMETHPTSPKVLMESPIFLALQRILVDLTLEFKGLVPVVVAFIDRLFGCQKHSWSGERLLQTFDQHLLPKLKMDYGLSSYVLIFDRISRNDRVPPGGLLNLLMHFLIFLVERHGPMAGLKSWSQGSKIIGICRTMMMYHHSSKLFIGLSRLLAYTCIYFPDLEVRDDARIYLRMLICIPGKKLRQILNSGEQLPGIAPSSQTSSYLNAQSRRQGPYDVQRCKTLSVYIHLDRVITLLVKQSWSLSFVSSLGGTTGPPPAFLDAIRDNQSSSSSSVVDQSSSSNIQNFPNIGKIAGHKEPLRVMDSRTSEVIGLLRRHFSIIPDFRHMPGIKIRIPCVLRFDSEPFSRVWGGIDLSTRKTTTLNGPPEETLAPAAIYAAVLTFSSSAPYGSIPASRVPFLLGETNYHSSVGTGGESSLDIVPITTEEGGGCRGGEEEENSFSRALLTVELEPREPVPGLVDVSIAANTEDGQIMRGQLKSITVGIEDMFLKAPLPCDIVGGEASYFSDLFDALWEACGSPSNIGHEAFPLQGGGLAAIRGTRSVKLLHIPMTTLVQAVESYLSPFVVCVVGETLVNIVRDGGVIKNTIWKKDAAAAAAATLDDDDVNNNSVSNSSRPLYLKYAAAEVEEDEEEHRRGGGSKKAAAAAGFLHILIFLPPRFHILFQMEVCDDSTLARIRTDHWPCLAYIDDYLEALLLSN